MAGKSAAREQVMYDTLKRIAKDYVTPRQIRRDIEKSGSVLSFEEYIEMAYDNMQQEAANAIKGMRRPAAKGANHG
jgi:uncharacterized protein (UPF0147 family)